MTNLCPGKCVRTESASPARQVRRDEGVVVQLGIGGVEPVDAVALARAQFLVGIEALDRGQQALPAQDLVAAGNAAGEVVVDIEHHGVAIGDEGIERHRYR